MNGPVRPRDLTELASAIERVDDPDAVGAETVGAVAALFGQDCIVWSSNLQFVH